MKTTQSGQKRTTNRLKEFFGGGRWSEQDFHIRQEVLASAVPASPKCLSFKYFVCKRVYKDLSPSGWERRGRDKEHSCTRKSGSKSVALSSRYSKLPAVKFQGGFVCFWATTTVLRVSLDSQTLLAVFRRLFVVLGIKPVLAICKASLLTSYCIGPILSL